MSSILLSCSLSKLKPSALKALCHASTSPSTLMSVIWQRQIVFSAPFTMSEFSHFWPSLPKVLTLLIKGKNKSLDMLGGEPPATLSLSLMQRSSLFLEELQNVCFLEQQRIVATSLFQFTQLRRVWRFRAEGREAGSLLYRTYMILMTFTRFQMSFCFPPHCKITN